MMDTKLTLKLDQKIIEKAKQYAADKKKMSLRILKMPYNTFVLLNQIVELSIQGMGKDFKKSLIPVMKAGEFVKSRRR